MVQLCARTSRPFAVAGDQRLKTVPKCCQMSCCPADQFLAAVRRRKSSALFITHRLKKLFLPCCWFVTTIKKKLIKNPKLFILEILKPGCQTWEPGGWAIGFNKPSKTKSRWSLRPQGPPLCWQLGPVWAASFIEFVPFSLLSCL